MGIWELDTCLCSFLVFQMFLLKVLLFALLEPGSYMVQCPVIDMRSEGRSAIVLSVGPTGSLVVVCFSLWLAGCLKTFYFKALFHKGTTWRELENILFDCFFFKWILKLFYLDLLPFYLGNQMFTLKPSLLFCVSVSSSERWGFRLGEWLVFKFPLLDHFRAGMDSGGGGRLQGCCSYFFKVTLLSSVLHWGFYIFTFELRTVKKAQD